MQKKTRFSKGAIESLLLLDLVMGVSISSFSRDKNEAIDATAFGTGTQVGQSIGVTLNIYEFSTPADKQILSKPTRRARTRDWQMRCSE